MPLIMYSKSTEKYIGDYRYTSKVLITEYPNKEILKSENTEELVIAIGGGKVIDSAKIVSKNRIVAIPTTFSGASKTSHSVIWINKEKLNVKTEKPITVLKDEYINLNEEDSEYSKADCLCHIFEALNSKKSTDYSNFLVYTALDLIKNGDWINASLMAGDLVEIVGTNVVHALSYPMTSIYNIPHGKALAYLLNKIFPLSKSYLKIKEFNLDVDIDLVINKALTYKKINNSNMKINKDILKRLLNGHKL